MAIGWLTALKILPWKDMIEYAPTVVSGAQKLWQRTRKKERDTLPATEATPLSPEESIAQLQQQMQELRAQQFELSQLVKELADQNQRLVQAVDVLRKRTRFLLGALLAAAIAIAVLYW